VSAVANRMAALKEAGRNWSLGEILGQRELYGCVYVVWDHDAVVYVGCAGRQSVATRIAIHLAASTREQPVSRFAGLLQQSHPRYFAWLVQVLTPQQCGRLLRPRPRSVAAAEQAIYDWVVEKQGAVRGNARRPNGRGCG
jgi:hypothetical protein